MNRAVRQHTTLPAAQRGAVVLLLLLILAVSTASYFLMKRLNGNVLNIDRDKITGAALAQAKAALIGYAAADSNRPGELICPDVNNDGKTDIPDFDGSDCRSLIGRLPWRTLRLPDLRDGYGERLWYALSDNFHATGSTPALNTSTSSQLSVTGTSPANAVIAIVFSPGPALGNQSRDSTNVNSVANYLEGDNANLDTVYETRNTSDTFNDKLLTITVNDLFSVVTHRVASEIGIQLAASYSVLPSSLPPITSPSWLTAQQWTDITITPPITTYAQISATKATLVFKNCPGLTYTVDVNNSIKTTRSGQSC